MIRWSYHVEALNISERWWGRKRQTEELTRLNQRLNNLGSAGWELVSYEATPMTGTFTQNIKGYAYLALFKQPQPWPGDDTSTQLDEKPAVQSEYSPVYEPLSAPFESQEPEPQEPEPHPVDVMPESVRECEHAFCDQPAEPEKPGFCQRHLEELRLLFAAIEIRCPECGNVAPPEAERQVRS
jgi:hypothetical protein